jgi:hypothetical protein
MITFVSWLVYKEVLYANRDKLTSDILISLPQVVKTQLHQPSFLRILLTYKYELGMHQMGGNAFLSPETDGGLVHESDFPVPQAET